MTEARIETVIDDDLDVNIASFISGEDYISIQICQYEEGDPQLDLPYIEHNAQETGQYGGIDSIKISPEGVVIAFKKDQLLEGRYGTACVDLKVPLTRDAIDFFVNHLFLSDYIRYSADFDPSLTVKSTAIRDRL